MTELEKKIQYLSDLEEIRMLKYRYCHYNDGGWETQPLSHQGPSADLFTEDGMYWMPAEPEQTTGDGVPSIFWEDRNLMTVRMRRMGHPHAWSQKTAWGTNHLVSNVRIEKADPKTGEMTVRSRFHMLEFRNDASRHFAGSYIHHLKKTKDGFRIRLQRVDMVNGGGTYDYVLQAWV